MLSTQDTQDMYGLVMKADSANDIKELVVFEELVKKRRQSLESQFKVKSHKGFSLFGS